MIDLINLALALNTDGRHCVGDHIRIGLHCTADPAVRAVAADIIIKWEPTVLRLDGIDTSVGTMPFVYCDFPSPKSLLNDLSGINEAIPPADGDALIYWLCELGSVVMADDDTMVVFEFTVVSPFTTTTVGFVPELTYTGYPEWTVIYGTNTPGQVATGTLTDAVIRWNANDINSDGVIGPADLAAVLSNWGSGSPALLAGVLGDWGQCN